MGGAGASTPTRGATLAATGGSSLNAKRPGTIDPITTPDGPLLDQQSSSKKIYALKRQCQAIENRANGVNANLADLATHLDLQRDKTEVNRLQTVMTFSKTKEAAELAESDLRRVHAEDRERDAQLRRELDTRSLPSF